MRLPLNREKIELQLLTKTSGFIHWTFRIGRNFQSAGIIDGVARTIPLSNFHSAGLEPKGQDTAARNPMLYLLICPDLVPTRNGIT